MKAKLHIYWRQYIYQTQEEGKFDIRCDARSYEDGSYLLVGITEVDVPNYTPPTYEAMTLNRIEVLRGEKQKVLAETQQKCHELDEAIQKLLALPAVPTREDVVLQAAGFTPVLEGADDDIPF